MRTSLRRRKPNENWQCYRVDLDTWEQMGLRYRPVNCLCWPSPPPLAFPPVWKSYHGCVRRDDRQFGMYIRRFVASEKRGGQVGLRKCIRLSLQHEAPGHDGMRCASVLFRRKFKLRRYQTNCGLGLRLIIVTALSRSTVRLFYVIRTLHEGLAGGGFPCLYFESCPCLAQKDSSDFISSPPLSVANRPICRTRD